MDLKLFVEVLQRKGELLTIDAPLDPCLEMSALTALAVRERGPALLFTSGKIPHPVLTNALGSEKRLALALNHPSLAAFGATASLHLESHRHHSGQPVRASQIHPREDSPNHHPSLPRNKPDLGARLDAPLASANINANNPTQETLPVTAHPSWREREIGAKEATFSLLPSMTLWPGDAGPCLTAAVVVTKDPLTGRRNAGIYRVQIIGPQRATLGWHPGSDAAAHFRTAEQQGRPLDVALIVGVPPAVLVAAGLPLPAGTDELDFAARATGAPLALAQCKTVDLLVPAEGQFVLEGRAVPGERAVEGPFGNHTGMQTAPRSCPVFQLQAVCQAQNPVFQCIVAGPPPSESTWIAKAYEAILRVRLCAAFPQIQDIAMPTEGIFQNFLFVAVRDSCRDALSLLRRLPDQDGLKRFRFLIAVDEGIDLNDSSQILWRIGNCLDPARDVVRFSGPMAPWHPSVTPGQGDKLLLDARAKNPQSRIPRHPDPSFHQKVATLWKTLHTR